MRERLRLADLLAGLSFVCDLGFGLPVETSLRSCMTGTELARRLGLSEEEVADVFYVSLLFHVGCVAYAHETTALFGDDIAVNRAVARTNLADSRELIGTLLPESTRGLPPAARVRGALRMTVSGRSFGRAHDQASCEVARATARRLRLPGGVTAGLYDVHEWWNGGGARGVRGDAIPLAARIARVAMEASVLCALDGENGVAERLHRRAGTTLDPHVVAAFKADAPNLLGRAASTDPRAKVLDLEPFPFVEIEDADLPLVAAAFGDLTDLKTPFLHGHSAEVARLAVLAAERLGLDRLGVRRLEIAGLLHDVGRVGISNRIWEKPERLTVGEWEQVRMHPYLSERVLSSAAQLAPMASLAGMHHERLDRSGYHRGCRPSEMPPAARVLGVADAFCAMSRSRPYRPALSTDHVADLLAREANGGRLDRDVVSAVLQAVGGVRPQRLPGPSGLTDRERQVIRLVAQGCSNPEIGRRLGISSRTAEHHVQHVYAKIGASTRAAAALYALEHGLLA